MKKISWTAFQIDRSLKVPVFEQICASLRTQIINGELSEGTRLPATRGLATDLGVSRSTVVTAYEQLVAEGYLESTQGAGFTVSPIGSVELETRKAELQAEEEETLSETYPLQGSRSDMALFPHRQWAKTVSRVCRTNPESMLVGNDLVGNFNLRKEIARHISEWRGIEASAHQIVITAGAGDGVELCIRTLARQKDRIAIENPGYLPLRNFIQALGYKSEFLTMDDQGAQLPVGRKHPQLIIITPSHQYPLGGAMSPARRLEFIQWAQDRDAWVIEDDYDSEFRYAGRPIPAMAGFDQNNRTIYVGTFSKVFSNSLRLGYVVFPTSIIDRAKITLREFGVRASYMPQQALAEFMKEGEFYRHLRRVRRIYGERRKTMTNILNADFARYGYFVDHQAGMQIVFHLHEPYDDMDIVQRARQEGLSLEALSLFCAEGIRMNGLILGFTAFSPEKIKQSLAQLKLILDQVEA